MSWLYRPFPASQISQKFGLNANSFYSENGLKGHTSEDYDCTFNAPILACADGLVYSVMNRNNPDLDKYRAVFQLVEHGDFVYEVSYGHLNNIDATVGRVYYAGEKLGTAGNTGPVYAQGRRVTLAEKLGGSTAGTHLHGPQVRKCRFTPIPDGQMLFDGNGLLMHKGKYVQVIDYANGFNGCVNPEQFYNGKTAQEAAQERIQLLTTLLKALQKMLSLLKR